MEGVYRGNERREEVRSRQNKLIENEALAEVQLAFPWESLSLSLRPSLENERGDTRSPKPRGFLDENSKERRGASKPL